MNRWHKCLSSYRRVFGENCCYPGESWVLVPMVTGAMVAVALFEFIRVWGDYLFTLTMLDDQKKFTLGIGMVQQFTGPALEFGQFSTYGGQAAAYIMAAAPTILFFLFLQRWFVRGLLTRLKT